MQGLLPFKKDTPEPKPVREFSFGSDQCFLFFS